jgi:hypothetical protein
MSELAALLSVPYLQLVALNAEADPKAPIPAGTRMCLPATNCTYHTIAQGEYLFSIADQYNTTTEVLVALNPWLMRQVSGEL